MKKKAKRLNMHQAVEKMLLEGVESDWMPREDFVTAEDEVDYLTSVVAELREQILSMDAQLDEKYSTMTAKAER